MVCFVRLKADVAVLVFTFNASHVVASFKLVSRNATFWTKFGMVLDFPIHEL